MLLVATQSKKAAKAAVESDEVKVEKIEVNYGPKGVKAGEHVFGVAHIYASFNDTFVVRCLLSAVACTVFPDCDSICCTRLLTSILPFLCLY